MPTHSFSKTCLALACTLSVLLISPPARAADRIKANNTTNLNLAGSWSPGVPDLSNTAVWTNVVTGTNTSLLGGDVSWQGIRIADPGGLVTIGMGNTLTLSSGLAGISIDMSAATQDLTIQSGLTIKTAVGQLWSIAAGRTLTLDSGTFTRSMGATLNVQGAGTVKATTLSNDTNGLIGAWATFGTGTTARYASLDGSSNIIGYSSGTAAATAAGVTDMTGKVNYDVAAVGAIGAGASFNTLRYTGAAGIITGNFTANGILTSGTGALNLSGIVTIGASGELVLANGDSNAARDIIISGSIVDGASGISSVTKAGLGNLTLSGANTYTGLTTISRGKVTLTSTGTLGSTSGGTRIGLSGKLSLAGGVTSAESIFLDDVANAFNGGLLIENIGTNTLTGAIRVTGNSTRWQSSGTLTVTGGISTTNGNSGTSLVVQAATIMNITGKPLSLGGGGTLYMDNAGKTIVLGVVGSTYGANSLYAGILQTNVANALSTTATINFGVAYSASPATLDLNGFDQSTGAIATSTYSVHSNYDRVITSATAATLTTGVTNASTTFDGRFAGAVSVIKTGTGTFNLSGISSTTGNFTVNGGTLNLTFGRATTSQSGAGAVSDYLPSAAPLTLGGGIFQLTGRNNGTATSLTSGSWASNNVALITVTSTAGLAPGQLVSNANFAAGAYVVSVLNSTQFIISAPPTVAPTGTITATTNSFTTSQTFSGLILNAGASGVTVTLPASGSDGTVLNLGAITLNAGATVNFTPPTGTQGATNGITTDTTNTNGILGGWARVGNQWAMNSTNAAGGNIVALTTYTDVSRLGGTIVSNASTNIRIVDGGASGSITPGAAGTTDIYTLLQTATVGAVTYDPGTADVLRLGAAGGIMVASNAGALTLGASANDGILTAGGAAATEGTLYLTNNHASNLLTVNSTITDNGAGVVGVTTSGAGIIVLAGTNTFTGRTAVGGGTLRISSEQNFGSGPVSFVADQLILAGGTLNTTASFSIDDGTRGITLAAAGGTLSVNDATTLTVANVIAGMGSLIKSNTGTLALTAANTYSGATFANAGTLALGHVNALQNSTLTTAAAGNVTFTLAGTNTYNIGGLAGNDTVALGANSLSVGANNETTVFTGSLSGTGGLIKVGAGTLNLTAASTFSGDTRIEGGMIVLADANALQNSTLDTGSAGIQSANLTLGEGTTYNVGGLKGSADFDLAVSNLSVGANNQSTTFNGVLQGAFNNNVTKVGSGTLVLAGNNTYIGTTTISAGRLDIDGTNLSSITVMAAGELGGEGSTSGNLVFLGTTHTLTIDAGTEAALGATGSGKIDVSALAVGGFTINISGIGTGAIKVLTYGSGGFIGDVNRFSLGTSNASAHGAGAFINNGIDAITVDLGYLVNTWVGGDGSHPTFWDIGITANWSNAKDNVFQIGDDVIFADGAASFTPILQSDITVGAVTFSNTLGTDYTVSSVTGQILTTANGIAVNGSGNVTINSVIAGNGGLTLAGTGTTTLSAANTYTGVTLITGGTLRISDETNLGTAPGVFNAGQITLDGVGATLTAAASLTINDTNRGIMLGNGGGGLGADAGVTLTIANVISGAGGLNKSGAGIVSLVASNTYTGPTTVSTGTLELRNVSGGNAIAGDGVAGTQDIQVNTGGTLKLAAVNQIADDAKVLLNGGIWNLGGFNETIRSLTGTFATTIPTLTLGGATLTLNRLDWDNNPGSVSSKALGDTGTLRFVADGATQPVFETNYLGTLGVTPGIQIDALSLSFRSGTYGTTLNGKVSGTGKLIFDGTGGAGGLTLTNATNDYSGGTQWVADGGTSGAWDLFTVTASGALGSGNVTLQGGNQNTWVAGFSGSPSAFVFSGNTTQANHFILSGDATISVGSTASASATTDKVALSGDFDLGSRTLYVRGAGTGTISGVISGTGGVTKIDTPGTWVLTGNNTYTGATTVKAGQLQVGNGGAGRTGTGDVTVQSGGTLYGTGVVQGPNFTAAAGSTVQAGDSTAAGSFGTLNFTPVTGGGTQSLAGQVILDIGTANNAGSVDPTFGGNVIGTSGYNSYVNHISRSQGLAGGSHDLLTFNTAGDATGYSLTLSGTLVVRASGSAEYGQVYNLLDWSTLVITDFSGFDVGANYRDGSGDDASQFNLPTLSGGLVWDVSQFTTSGIIVVVPEPGRVVLILLGFAALVSRRRRGRDSIEVRC